MLIVLACSAAAWWQVTRALSGNGLSWFYSLEWPAFALLAIAGWWHLIHEDPEHFRARKQRGRTTGRRSRTPTGALWVGSTRAVTSDAIGRT